MGIPIRKRWIVTIVGAESGTRTPVSFLRFRSHRKAAQWLRTHQMEQSAFIAYEIDRLNPKRS